jgi:hypothetical protein
MSDSRDGAYPQSVWRVGKTDGIPDSDRDHRASDEAKFVSGFPSPIGPNARLTRWSQWVDATLRSNPTCIENKDQIAR